MHYNASSLVIQMAYMYFFLNFEDGILKGRIKLGSLCVQGIIFITLIVYFYSLYPV